MQFKDIIGQEAIKEKLIKSIREDRVAHAQLFLGAQGAGALPLAFAYAQYLNCINKGETDSCGSCSSCRKYSKLIHPDLHLSFPFYPKNAKETALDYAPEWKKAFLENPYLSLDSWREAAKAENKLANINIAECHRIIQTLSLKSFEAEYKVLIMWLPEYLKNNGNALLKLIEEPAPKTLFILVAQQPDQLLNTILSRAQLIKINAPTDAEIEDFFIKNEQVNPQKAKQIAFLSEGNLEKAFQLHRDKSDLAMYEHFRQWILYCYKEDVLGVTEFVDRVLAKPGREQQKSLLSYAISIFREVL